MIARLRGELLEADGGRVVIDVGGVGYELLVPESVLVQLPAIGDRVDLQVRQVFREDGTSLYGFVETFQRRMFDLLTDVKGCGPKTSLALIGMVGEENVASAIVTGDVKLLTRATGVGPRLAERIILELKDKVLEENLTRKIAASSGSRQTYVAPPDDELVEALLALGYRRTEAESAADQVREGSDNLEGQLKSALRVLRR